MSKNAREELLENKSGRKRGEPARVIKSVMR